MLFESWFGAPLAVPVVAAVFVLVKIIYVEDILGRRIELKGEPDVRKEGSSGAAKDERLVAARPNNGAVSGAKSSGKSRSVRSPESFSGTCVAFKPTTERRGAKRLLPYRLLRSTRHKLARK